MVGLGFGYDFGVVVWPIKCGAGGLPTALPPSWRRSMRRSISTRSFMPRISPAPRRMPPCWRARRSFQSCRCRRHHPGPRPDPGRDRGRSFQLRAELEDIHLNIESRLKEILGEPAGRLHTARSRNDQVATDFRLYVREAVDTSSSRLTLMLALAERQKPTPPPSCPALPTCSQLNRSPSVITCSPMLKCCRATPAASRRSHTAE